MALPTKMQAIVFSNPGDPSVLSLAEVDVPKLETEYDILVKLHACSLNPVDTKARQGAFPTHPVLGYDGAGMVVSAGSQARFSPGDRMRVMYSGVLGRSGTNALYGVVDSRMAGAVPSGWSWADAAALPLVGMTAWEMLEEHFGLKAWPQTEVDDTLVIVNGAGGVGSIATQLARKVFKLKNVVVTASRPETIAWAQANGATHVLDHHADLSEQLAALALTPGYAFICYGTATYLPPLCKSMRPFGKIGSIVEDPSTPLPFSGMDAFSRCLSFHWEFMFARPLRGYHVEAQGRMLGELKKAAERGEITSLVRDGQEEVPLLGEGSLRAMHELSESGKGIGKIAFRIGDTIGA